MAAALPRSNLATPDPSAGLLHLAYQLALFGCSSPTLLHRGGRPKGLSGEARSLARGPYQRSRVRGQTLIPSPLWPAEDARGFAELMGSR